MAETLKKWPSGTHRSRNDPYPWEKWFDGKIWKLRFDVDYFISSDSFRGVLGMSANRLGLKVKTAIVDGGRSVVIQALTTEKS